MKSLKALKLMNRYFGQVPKVLRNISNVDLTHVLPKSKEQIKVFGDLSEIMTGKILIREALG